MRLDAVALRAEQAGLPWLARLARAAAAVDGNPAGGKEALVVAEECDRLGDQWGAFLARLTVQLGRSLTERTRRGADGGAGARRAGLDSGVFTAWTQSLLALAATRHQLPDAELEVRRAESLARAAGVPGARVLALAAARAASVPQPAALMPAPGTSAACCTPPRRRPGCRRTSPPAGRHRPPTGDVGAAGPDVELSCFGGFRLQVGGHPLDWSSLRPQARTLARMLAMNAGRPVHRDELVEALWPDADRGSATQRLHVALSSLRRFLEANLAGAGGESMLNRDGDAYLLPSPRTGTATWRSSGSRCSEDASRRAPRPGWRRCGWR